MKNIKAVAFDAWGTLFDEGGDSISLTAAKIANEMKLTISPEEFLKLWTELYFKERFTIFNIRQRNIITLNEAFKILGVTGNAEKYSSFMIDARWANSIAYPEVPEVLQSIELPKCVISNIDDDTLLKALDKNGLVFEQIMTSEMANAYKPNPKIFQYALRLLGCDNTEVLFVGDSQRDDIVGAKNAGMPMAWVNRNKDELEEGIPKPDYEIEDLTSLLEILR